MRKFRCAICGYIYDEAVEKLAWDELPPDWRCPLCGAAKSDFEEMADTAAKKQQPAAPVARAAQESMKELSNAELSILCSNLAKGCEKQYLADLAELFTELADYYKSKSAAVPEKSFNELAAKIAADLDIGFPAAKGAASAYEDRGAKRALTWSEKVTRMLSSLLARYAKEGDAMAESTNVYVCDICGFVYIGDEPPAVCPVCKVPSLKILKVERR